MLTYLRENTGNWIIKLFLGIIVIVFVFLGVGSFTADRNNSVASINDEPITVKEYQQAYKAIIEQYRARFGNRLNEDLLNALNIKKQALEQLIDQKILLSEAEKLGIVVSKTELRDNLMNIKAFQENGVFNMELYKMVLGRNAMNPEIFEKLQMDALRQKKLTDMVLSTVNVSDLEAGNWYVFQNEQRAVSYLQFNPATYTDIQPSEKDIKKYYEANKEKYKSSLMREAEYIKFSVDDYKDAVNISDQQIKAQYEQNLEKYKVAERVEARHILIKVNEDATQKEVDDAFVRAQKVYEKAREGGDFQELAKTYSEGPSKSNGGYLGIFERKRMVKPFADKAFSMKAGEISPPVRTIFGWHIINVMNRLEASTKELEEVQKEIKMELETLALQTLAYDEAGDAFDAVIDGDDFEQVAAVADKTIVKTPAFDNTGKGLSVKDKRTFAQTAFDLTLDTISDVKQLGQDYYLIQVKKIIEPEVQPLEIVKKTVQKDFQAELQRQAALKDAQAVLESVKDSGDLSAAGKSFSMKLGKTPMFSRNGNIEGIEATPEFIKAAFSLDTKNSVYPEVIEQAGGYYVIALDQKKQPDAEEVAGGLKSVKEQILSNKKMQSMQAWMNEVKKSYDIEYDANMFN